MFKSLIEKYNTITHRILLKNDPLFQTATKIIDKAMKAEDSFLGTDATPELKAKIADNLLKEVTEIIFSENRILANREKLAAAVIMMAKYQVLVLPSEIEGEDITGLRGKVGISGELKSHLVVISKRDKEINSLISGLDNPTKEDVFEACYSAYCFYGFKANLFHTLRIPLKDYDPDPKKDWYRPFIAAMCAVKEHHYREAIGLGDILSENDKYGSLTAMKYSTFLDMVTDGIKNPNLEFLEYYSNENDKCE